MPSGPHWMADPEEREEREAWLASREGEQPPPDPEADPGCFPDPEDPALPYDVDLAGWPGQ